MTASKIIATMLALLFAPLVHADEPASSHIDSIEQFIAAFNAHDSGAMARLVTDDIAWLSIANGSVAAETKGKDELISSMDAYFKSCPTCQSALSGVISTPGRVSAVEVATWQGKTGPRSQRSLSVYEFSEGLIHRVYYFPAEM
jgi:hypothetical protein